MENKGWKYKTGKLRGAFGQTDFKKKTITIDKKKHAKGLMAKNPDGTESMAVTIKHELLHKQHPDWSEKKVESAARAWKKKASPKEKQRAYNKFN